MRSGLLAEELGRRGHEVTWWVSGFDHFSKLRIMDGGPQPSPLENVNFEVLAGPAYRRNVSLRRIANHLVLARRFRQRAAVLPKPDLIIANLPEQNIAYEAAKIATTNGIPLLCDLRDLWPDFFVDALPFDWLRPLARVALARDFARSRFVLQTADVLVTMMPSFLDWAYQVAGRRPGLRDQVFMLGAPSIAPGGAGTSSTSVAEALARGEGKLVALFIGSFSRRSYPLRLLEAARRLAARRETGIHFVIAGDGDYMSQIGTSYAEIPNLSFTGWVDEQDIQYLLRHADIGVVTANESLNALPNKIFTYLAGGLPLINAIEGDAAALVESSGCGLNVRFDDVDGLMKMLAELNHDRGRLGRMAQASARLFREHCSAERIYGQFATLAESLMLSQAGRDL